MNADLLKLKESMAAKGLRSNREFDVITKAFVYQNGYLPLRLAIADSGFKAGLQELRKKYPLNPMPVKKYIDDKQCYTDRQTVIKVVEEGLQQLTIEPRGGNQYLLLLKVVDNHKHLFNKKKRYKNRFAELRKTVVEKRKQHNELYQGYKKGQEILNKVKSILSTDRLDTLSSEQCDLLLPALAIAIDRLINNPFLIDVFEMQAFKKMIYAYVYLSIKLVNTGEQSDLTVHGMLAKTIQYCSYLIDNDFNKFQMYYWRGLCYALQGEGHRALTDFDDAVKGPNQLDKDSYEKAIVLKKLFEIDLSKPPTVFNLGVKVLSDKKNPDPLSPRIKQTNMQERHFITSNRHTK